jgi:heat shock protein HslJ
MIRKLLILITLTTLLLSACSAVSGVNDPLDGSSWQLSSYNGKSPLAGTTVTLEFKDGQAGGKAGCNGYGSAYEVDGEKLVFREVASTLMACTAPGVMEQEAEFLGSLNDVERFELSDGRLQLYRSGGEALTFIPTQ